MKQAQTRRSGDDTGMILVVTLAMILLITIAVMAFFSRATSNRQVESSRTHRIEAGVLARTGQEHVTGLLLEEITDPINSQADPQSGVTIYTPRANTNIVPERKVSAGVDPAVPEFFNLIRQSVSTADADASDHLTSALARNGRSVGANRWNAPELLGGSGFAGDDQLPAWIYVTRTGLTDTPSQEVIGRFAYNAYDIGGLLDINAAGYPGMVSSPFDLKSSVAGADLTQLPAMMVDAIDELIGFRTSDTVVDAGTYKTYVKAFERIGFMSSRAANPTTGSPFTNNAFRSRQDLLRYARTQNTTLADALPYLTHFSRSVNAPSVQPATPDSVNPGFLSVRFSAAGTVAHYRDDGTPDDYTVKAGDPLVQRRFSLAKLAWLTPTGPALNISAEAIEYCFGLRWNPGEDRWDYIPTEANEIKTLSQVAAENREPNFFELLKAGLIAGSLGLVSTDQVPANHPMKTLAALDIDTVDGNKDLHVLAVGANIIDCADADNYPTIVALAIDGGSGPTYYERAGIEDLPYLYCLSMASHRKMEVIATPRWMLYNLDVFWVPEFFSVHQQSSPSSGPDSISMSLTGSRSIVCFVSGGSFRDLTTSDLASLGSIVVPRNRFEDFRSAPRSFVDGTSPNRMGSFLSNVDPSVADVAGFHIYSYPGATALTLPREVNTTQSPWNDKTQAVGTEDMIVRLQYPAASGSGRWKTYATFGGNEADPGTGIQGTFDDFNDAPIMKQANSVSNLKNHTDLSKMAYMTTGDPRSSRFGPSLGLYMRPRDSLPAVSGTAERIGARTTPGVSLGLYLDQWPGQFGSIADPDGISRPTDATVGNSSYRDIIQNAERRPVILQRPYRTVAELGYVFRDTPWKTLDLSDADSADAAILDIFAISDQPVLTASRINLNTPYSEIRQALLSGEGQVPAGTDPLSGNVITALADRYQGFAFQDGAPTADMPRNVAELTRFMSDSNVQSSLSGSPLNYKQEAVVRALGDTTQTRTWNVLIDAVAQTGRFADNTFGPADFLVEGEHRSWLSVAIDRYTGEVVDMQIERVNE